MRKLAFIFAGALLCSIQLLAQNTSLSGRVTDSKDGSPLAGVSVTAKGSNVGVNTDADGNFSITFPNSAKTLNFSYVGYLPVSRAVGKLLNLDVQLTASQSDLDEVIVTGFGTQRKRDVTTSIATIGGDKIRNLPIQTFEQALSGKAAGVNVTMPNGVLGNPPIIRVRGVNSISGGSSPLIVIDGVPVFSGDISTNLSANNALGNLNPADIEDVQVLKDAASAAIYGSRAANGVMLITTKKGKSGKAKVSYDMWVGSTRPFKLFDVLNAPDYVNIKNEAVRNLPGPVFNGHVTGSPLFFLDTVNGALVDTKWNDEVYQTGFQQNHNLSVSGGANGTRYFFSTNYTRQDGMIQTNTFDRKQMRMNIDHKVTNWLTIGGNFNFSRVATASPSTGSLPGTPFNTSGAARLAFITAPNLAPYLADGRYNIRGIDNAAQRNSFNAIGLGRNLVQTGLVNPVMIRDLNIITSQVDQLQGNIFAELKLLKGLTFRTQYGVNWQNAEDKIFYNSLHGDGIGSNSTIDDDGLASNVFGRYEISNFQNYLTYNFSLKNKHNFNLTAGTEEQRTKTDRWGGQRAGLTDQFYNEYQGSFTINANPPGNALTENYLLSFFGRANYDYNNKYFISLTGRRDGYSAFAEGKKWGNFYGASAGWNISEESFWGGLKNTVNLFRLRGSYGQVGNLAAVGNFASLSTFGPGLYGLGYPVLAFNQAGNQDLSWETSTKLDVGFQFGLWNDRITGEVTYYNSDLKNLIINRPLPSSMGVPGNSIAANAANMFNRGIELTLNARVIEKKDFTWSIGFNITTQKNEVTALAPGVTEIIGTTGLERTNITVVGKPIGTFFAVRSEGVDPATGRRIFLDKSGRKVFFNFANPSASRYQYEDGTNAPSMGIASDGVFAGNALPTYYGGFQNNFYYKGFDFLIDAFFSGGNKVYFGSQAGMLDQRFWNNFQEIKSRWTKPGDVTDIPRIVYGDNISNGSAFPITRNLYDGSFFRVRTLALGYTLPAKWTQKVSLSNVRVYTQVLNPFIITSYPGIDPEISVNGSAALTPGVDRNSVGQARTYTFGINVGF